jgi:tetratricopeptide (TPR) repeat protein
MNAESEKRNERGGQGDSALELFKEGRDEESLSKSSDRLIDLYTRALAADEKSHELTDRDKARAKRWLSYALSKTNKYEEAKPYALTGLNDKMASGETDRIFTGLAYEVVRVCERTGDYKLALERAKVADEYYLKRLGKPCAPIRILKAEIYTQTGHLDKAMEIYRVLSQTMEPDHDEYREMMHAKAVLEGRLRSAPGAGSSTD